MSVHGRSNPSSPVWDDVLSKFQTIWGYSSFRSPQGEIIQCLLNQQDALVVMPTGGGKSICFQLPALLSQGVTLVISPLVALMENQVAELRQRRLPAALLHSELPSYERKQTLRALETNQLSLLYLSPETLFSPAVWERLCLPQVVINGMILDEAHCLVQWGDTFRPAYQRLGTVRPALLRTKPAGTQITIAAFTATADPQAQQTIQQILQLQQPQTILQSPYRANLHLTVKIAWTPRGRRWQLLRFIQSRPNQAGLVYVRTRRDGEALAQWFTQQGYSTVAYHAGLSPEDRRAIESAWLSGRILFVVCTSAFGMGINHPHVRWVIHFHVPILLSEYIQEIGRAGRDGEPAQALSLVSEPTGWLDSDDRQRHQYFQQQRRKQFQTAQTLLHQIPKQGDVNHISRQFPNGAIALALLHSKGQLQWHDPFHYEICSTAKPRLSDSQNLAKPMVQYLTTRQCRWQMLLNAFGCPEAAKQLGKGCGHCDRCDRTR
jgi:ATP-dependent DNA helicase RecQ